MDIKDLTPEGPGPFAIPLLAKLVSIDQSDPHESFLLARFQFEDGTICFVPIGWEAVKAFVEIVNLLPAVWKSHGTPDS